MSYIKPEQVIDSMIQTGTIKSQLSIKRLLLRGVLAGALLGVATTLAYQAAVQTKINMAGALIFPVGFVMIVLLGLELVTGNFALLPLSVLERKTKVMHMLRNWSWVFVGNMVGAVLYGLLYYIAITKFGHVKDDPITAMIIKAAETKTIGYKLLGFDGFITVFVKSMLCNWMVCLGAVMAMTSQSTGGKIAAMWLPIITFFGQGFEHSVVNMFVIPTGMLMGAKVSFADWWLWNQIPVTLGNLVGGLLFTGLALYLSHKRAVPTPSVEDQHVVKSASSM
ncbi:formate/nitrite transporter family protein [Paenibacillus polysaccharolyticus]|uniref:formate/nitrite transporter family protein n=1 Tax=Paenibacillus polysaccharolyticus TaxID=582692 RepID=UPI00209E1BCE|nr:formate/nitrite transporter family protein [Paenibacillus polysaccharolyticus]MCP1136196.1 formate/nitrite transporter family protein [Paenibacillus polysaccharolyticus]